MASKIVQTREQAVRALRRQQRSAAEKPVIRVVEVALEAVKFLCKTPRGIGVREMARALGVGKSTMHRILQTLDAKGLVRQDQETSRYVITAHLMGLASLILENLEFRRVARPFLEALQKRCGETVFLGVLDGAEVVIVDRIDSQEPLRMVNDIGFREPAHSTALGKSILASLPDEQLHSSLHGLELKALTPKTITSVETLKAELNRVQLSGFAIDDEESTPGVRCVGAPVRDAFGSVIAAVSVSGPSVRITPDRIPSLAQEVRSTAETISRELGFREDSAAIGATSSDSVGART